MKKRRIETWIIFGSLAVLALPVGAFLLDPSIASSDGEGSGVSYLLFGVLALAGFAMHFLPSIVAELRKHPQGLSILVVNLFLGWTLIGWVVALAWAVSAQKRNHPKSSN